MELEEQKPNNIVPNGEIKQEMEDFLKNVKKEPIDEEYAGHLIPKIEETMEPSASYLSQAIHLKNPVQKFFMQTQTVGPKINVEPERDQEELHVESQNNNKIGDSQYHRCSVCLQNCPLENMKDVSTAVDKLVIMVGCVLRGSYTLDQAQWFMSSERRVSICSDHFSESINKIYEVLNIKNANEITSCSSELMKKLMITVNEFIPQIGSSHFCDNVHDFVRRYITKKRKRQNCRCTVCTQVQSYNNMKNVSMQDEKLVIMIGCILRGDYTVEQARSFISQKKYSFICHVHFFQTANEICKFLDIKQLDEVVSCSTVLLSNLIVTVNELSPSITISHFYHLFNAFVTRNKKLLDRDVVDGEVKQETHEFFENVKEEPIDEEYSDQIVPKLEEVIEQPTNSNMRNQDFQANNPIQKFFNDAQKPLPKLDIEPQASTICYHRCSVCLQMRTSINVREVKIKEDKLVIMVGYVLRGDYTPQRAQLFMSKKHKMHICYAHFVEALKEIYKSLNIKILDEITSCSSELMNHLMNTVNVLYPLIETAQFCDIIHDFVRRSISQNLKRPGSRCSVCAKALSSKNMRHGLMQDEELVLMIGCVLRGEYTVEQARSFISQKEYSFICHAHFSKTINEIYKALSINNPYEIYSCSAELFTNLMIIVNKLCPHIEPKQFRTSLDNFFTRNNYLL